MLRKLTLVNHYYMPYTELMRKRITHLSSAFRVCAGVRLQKSCNRMLDRSSRVRQNSPLLRFSASPLRAFSAHPPHTDRPHIMGTQYTHRTVRTKDIPSPCVFLFFYQKGTIKIAGWKTFFLFLWRKHTQIFPLQNSETEHSAYTCLPLSAGFLEQRPKQCRKKDGVGKKLP